MREEAVYARCLTSSVFRVITVLGWYAVVYFVDYTNYIKIVYNVNLYIHPL